MEVVHPRCAGIDVSKKDAKVCVRIQGGRGRKTTSTVTTWGAMTNQVLALKDHLAEQGVTVAVMESTSDYWRPFYYVLEADLEVLLVNARDVKNVPGRKTDVSDAAWLADLGAHGLLRASFVPPEPIRQLRDLTRARTHITQGRTREIQRLEKLLESAGIKLSSVATDITGVSGRLMLQALIDSNGTADPAVMADLAKRRMRSKIPVLTEALNGRFTAHHAFMTRLLVPSGASSPHPARTPPPAPTAPASRSVTPAPTAASRTGPTTRPVRTLLAGPPHRGGSDRPRRAGPPRLAPVYQAITTTDAPRTALNWLRNSAGAALLTQMASGATD